MGRRRQQSVLEDTRSMAPELVELRSSEHSVLLNYLHVHPMKHISRDNNLTVEVGLRD
jgi:hypothetical protein